MVSERARFFRVNYNYDRGLSEYVHPDWVTDISTDGRNVRYTKPDFPYVTPDISRSGTVNSEDVEYVIQACTTGAVR